MRTSTLRYIVLCFACMMTVQLWGQDYLQIHFRNGGTERHLLSLVEKISTTKLDNEGTLHPDYQLQQIFMTDTVYSYPLSEIDSITYHKVDVEQIEKSLEEVIPVTAKYFEQCATVGEMESHLDEIRQLDGVESAWRYGTTIYVQIKDWYRFSFYYPVNDDGDPAFANEPKPMMLSTANPEENLSSAASQSNIYSSKKVVIANQQAHDKSKDWYISHAFLPLKEEFESLGFEVKYDENPDLDFFNNRMYDYDIVLLNTHGHFDGQRHWIVTSDMIDDYVLNDPISANIRGLFIRKYGFDLDQLDFACVSEQRNASSSHKTSVIYTCVSEDYIRNTAHRFKEGTVFFTTACETLKGSRDLFEIGDGTTVSGNSSFADILFDKGIELYYGFNETVYTRSSICASVYFYENMLMGSSAWKAFSTLPDEYKYQETNIGTTLFPLYVDTYLIDLGRSDTSKKKFITKTTTDNSADYSNNGITVSGITSTLTGYYSFITGFRYGTDNRLAKFTEIDDCGFEYIVSDKGDCKFTAQIPVENGQTIYYQAFTFDGLSYNLGDICSYTASVQPEKQAQMEVTPLEIDFEKVEVGTTAEKTFTVKNTGNADLSYMIQCLSDDRPYYVPDGKTSLTLAPGKSKTHKVCFAPDREGGAYYTFEITSNAANSGAQTISLKGSGINPQPIGDGYVDLGLSVMWATCNIGADSPVEFGEYFAWGETVTKESFEWDNYKFCKGGSQHRITKYCDIANYGENGFTDGKTVLDPEDDVAHLRLGDGHRIPTANEWVELFNNCSIKYELNNGVKGIWLTSKINSNRIFLPFTREYGNGSNYGSEYVGNYWSANLSSPAMAYYAGINQTQGNVSAHIRCIAKTIRPILSDADISSNTETLDFGEVEMYDSETEYLKICNNGSRPITVLLSVTDNSMFKTDTDARYTIEAGSSTEIPVNFTPARELDYKSTISVFSTAHTLLKTITVIGKGTNSNIPAEAVDLGLSVKWASYNVGAHKPEEFGNHYAWGETDVKENYSWETYKYCEGSQYTLTKYNDYGYNGVVDNKVILDPEDDAAYMKWHGNWRTPTKEEWDELIKNCSCTLTQLNGVTGFKLTSKVNGYTDKWIFLPCAGYYTHKEWPSETIYESSQTALEYWSATSQRTTAYAAYNNSGRLATGGSSTRCNGYPVRPVSD